MSGQSTCSLSEALTALAFNDPTPAAIVPDALKTERWACSSAEALMRMNAAVHTLCDAGYRGDVKIWGRPITRSQDVAPRLGIPKKLDQAECLHNRLFVPGRDGLWPGGDDEYADMFSAEASGGGFDEVRVDQAEFDKFRATTVKPTSGAVHECVAWLLRQFAADPKKQMKKEDFKAAALVEFVGRLSGRGFDRAWAQVAPGADRDKPGPKTRHKSNHSTK